MKKAKKTAITNDKLNRYYILNGHKVVAVDNVMDWSNWFEHAGQKRIVKQESLENGYWVSTVFLGTNHNFFGGKPLLFETMVFGPTQDEDESDQERYSTWDEAEAGHREMVKKWRLKWQNLNLTMEN